MTLHQVINCVEQNNIFKKLTTHQYIEGISDSCNKFTD